MAPGEFVRIRPVISRVHSFVLQGIDAVPCEIEVNLSPSGLPKTTTVGLPDVAVKESSERVRSALFNAGYRYPHSRVTINLAPADLRKEGPVYDLPVAVAMLRAQEIIEEPTGNQPTFDEFLIAGELALDGRVRPIKGAISLAMLARSKKIRGVLLPSENAPEAAVVDGVEVYGVSTIAEVVGFFNGTLKVPPLQTADVESLIASSHPEVDFGDVRGQETAKRAITIAAAGAHNILLIGPAGTGKTMMARALPGVLPVMTREEALDVTRIYSSIGAVPRGASLIAKRPVRTPHHTASTPAVVGGGTVARPGEVSLAHRGVLFLDELPEFHRDVLESMREPLEDGHVTIARASGSMKFPARFMLVAAMNPTFKGNGSVKDVSQRQEDRYLSRLSGPLIDRIDIHVEVPAVPFKQLASQQRGTDSAEIRAKIAAARAVQQSRQGAACNAELKGKALDQFAEVDEAGRTLLGQAMTELGLSARAYDKVRRVARTIADLEGSEPVQSHHVGEAVQYRLLDRQK
jgi:magnesium chelatase family protein